MTASRTCDGRLTVLVLRQAARLERMSRDAETDCVRADLLAAGRLLRVAAGQEPGVVVSAQRFNAEVAP